ncbi:MULTISPECIES: CalY family protein [unclassified Oceanobacillus]|uniref:CalY family protein n=1 Tax=unclassified Oceanobacillus TaxID=2630292 RepID=UPI0012EC9174|nr:CalY family protein [Oceanobacillus sp. AG]
MDIKKKLGMAAMSAVLGITLIAGGTFAYFSSTEVTNNTFAAGTLDLSVNPSTIVEVENLAPGDSIIRSFELVNNGSLDIEKVTLETDYTVHDAHNNNTEDFANHIEVEFLYNVDKLDEVIYRTTLAELKEMTPDAINQHIFYPALGEKGLPVNSLDDFVVKFNFVDNGGDQNQFQGDSLDLKWTFVATQNPGSQK